MLPGWHRKQMVLAARSGVGLDAGVHAHVEGISKGIGWTSEKWSPKGEITKCWFHSATSRDGACAAGSMGGSKNTPDPTGAVVSVKGGGWRGISPSSNPILCVLLMADHWEEMSGGASGAPLAVWVMKAGRNPCDGAVEHRAVLSPAKDCCRGRFLGLSFGKILARLVQSSSSLSAASPSPLAASTDDA